MSENESNESALEKWQRFKAEGRPVAEHILNIIKAGLSSAPFAGAIASLMTDYIPTARAQRLEQFAEQIADDLRRLQDRVRAEYLQTDNFAFMFEKCFRGAEENPQKEKLDAFRGILVNSAISKELSEEEKEYFVHLVNNLTVLHIRILKFMVNPDEYLGLENISQDQIHEEHDQFFPIVAPGIQFEVIRSVTDELYRIELIDASPPIFSTMTLRQGLQLLSRRVTELGKQFIQFCISPNQ